MKSKERYHHGNLRNACVEAGTRLLEEKGPEGFSMREVARRAKVAPSAPYRHFEDRGALLTAISLAAREQLDAILEEEMAKVRSPLGSFRVGGMATVRFALLSPSLYRVIQNPEVLHRPEMEALREASDALDEQGLSAIAAAQQAGLIRPDLDPSDVLLMGETVAAGLAAQVVSGQFEQRGLDAAAILAFTEKAFAMFAESISV